MYIVESLVRSKEDRKYLTEMEKSWKADRDRVTQKMGDVVAAVVDIQRSDEKRDGKVYFALDDLFSY